jgi:hypothetical protein
MQTNFRGQKIAPVTAARLRGGKAVFRLFSFVAIRAQSRASGLVGPGARGCGAAFRWEQLSDFSRGLAVFVAVLLTVASLHALELTEWKNRQALNVNAAGIISFAVPVETLDAARADLGDLRLVDSAGREVAYVLHQATRPVVQPVAARSFRSTLTDASTQLIIECGPFPVEEITLQTPARAFLKRARIETSPNGSAWEPADEGVPLFRQAGAEQLSVRVNARFVRVTLDDSRSPPVPFLGARIVHAPATPAVVAPLGARILRREEFAGETLLTLELDAAHVPLDTLTFTTPERLFTRRVMVGVREMRDEAAVERTLATGAIYNIAIDGETPTTRLSVPLGVSAPSRELILHIANDDSPPLAITGVTVSRFEVTAYFDAAAPGGFALLTGHRQIAAPRYDVSHLRVDKATRTTAITPGPLTPNPGYAPPEALAGTPLLGGALDPTPRSYRRPVQLAAAGVQQMELDLDVLVHAQRGFGDLRLLRDGTQIPYVIERPALSRSLTLALASANDPKQPRLSRWEIKLPRAGLPLTQLTLTSPTNLFQRHLRIFERVTDDRGNPYERTVASVEWSHTRTDRGALVLPLTSTLSTDNLLVETDNGDNPPIVLSAATSTYPVTRLLFKTDVAPLVLFYGNRQTSAPRYDLTLVANQLLTAEKQVATLAPEEKAKPDGWTKTALGGGRAGIIFWAALALVVVALLVIVAKLLPKPPATSAQE